MSKSVIKIVAADLFLALLLTMASCKTNIKESTAEPVTPDNNIILSDAQIQLANIKVAKTEEAEIGQNIILTGVLKVNEQSAVNISSRATGRIQKLFFKKSGESVNKGDSLYQFYCEDLIAAEREYALLQNNNWNFSGKFEPSLVLENKLLYLGMLPVQISELKKNGKILFTVTILSPLKGTIRSVKISEGQYVSEGETLFELADENNLWVEAQAYQNDLKYLKPGMLANLTLPVASNITLPCRIFNINPSSEKGRDITIIRSVIDNSEKQLYPGMLAIMSIQVNKTMGIAVPVSAVISEVKGDHVWIRNGDGSFSARLVNTGIQSDDSVIINSGLKRNEQIVTSGAYLLYSEQKLKKGIVSGTETDM